MGTQISFATASSQILHYTILNRDDNYEITMDGYQARKINEIRDVILGLQLWETFLSV